MALKDIITYVSIFAPLVPVITGFQKRPLLWYYAIAGFLSDCLIVFLLQHRQERMFVGNIYVLVEFFFIYYYYRKQLRPGYGWLFLLSIGIFTGAFFKMFYVPGNGFLLENTVLVFNWMGAAMLCIPYLAFALSGFRQIIQEQKIMQLERSAFFITNTIFITYYSTVFLVLLFTNYLIDANKITWFWRFLEAVNIIKYFVLARVFTLKNP